VRAIYSGITYSHSPKWIAPLPSALWRCEDVDGYHVFLAKPFAFVLEEEWNSGTLASWPISQAYEQQLPHHPLQ
jgi:hypothetical protein